ncbi:MAG: adenosylmethionine--8-amino-7-oxononanoate transaminase [Kiritimatiellaeota bacterium]|nr:adenosylmethionine--8-amino-7-oxononanoate transaminase [Kiritimatiellota bacterium]
MKQPDYAALDRRHLWHPYTKFSSLAPEPPPLIVRGEGIYLFDQAGRKYVDAIASWWCCALGHGHPRIVAAIARQARELQHSILGNLSHPRAVELAAQLAALLPTPDRHVLFAGDGASAVEAALKIALQYRHNCGQPRRTKFAALHGAYHGDTLGAVSVGYVDEFHRVFRPLLQPAVLLPLPERPNHSGARPGAPAGAASCAPTWAADFAPARRILDAHAAELTAVIVEPLCLGAAGMRMYPAGWLAELAAWCQAHDVLLIVDEIAMGFGRTGKMFAFEHAGVDPDIVCVGKALSAGYLPISATIVKDEIYRTFDDQSADHTFYHGHTFCGNPIAAAAALETLHVFAEDGLVAQVAGKARRLAAALAPLAALPQVKDVRGLGLIAAVELQPDDPPRSPSRPQRIRQGLFEHGVLLRPLGHVVYLLPPLVITDSELEDLAGRLTQAIQAAD